MNERDLIWKSSSLFGAPLTLGARGKLLLLPPAVSGTGLTRQNLSVPRFHYLYLICNWHWHGNRKGLAWDTNLSDKYKKSQVGKVLSLKTISETVQKTPKQWSTQRKCLQRRQNQNSFPSVSVQTHCSCTLTLETMTKWVGRGGEGGGVDDIVTGKILSDLVYCAFQFLMLSFHTTTSEKIHLLFVHVCVCGF